MDADWMTVERANYFVECSRLMEVERFRTDSMHPMICQIRLRMENGSFGHRKSRYLRVTEDEMFWSETPPSQAVWKPLGGVLWDLLRTGELFELLGYSTGEIHLLRCVGWSDESEPVKVILTSLPDADSMEYLRLRDFFRVSLESELPRGLSTPFDISELVMNSGRSVEFIKDALEDHGATLNIGT